MPKQSFKQKLKESVNKLKPAGKTNNQQFKKPAPNKEKTKSSFNLSKIKLSFKKKIPEQELPSVTKSLPKGIKIVDKYPLYEPFAQVVIVQDPKTGEHKYISR